MGAQLGRNKKILLAVHDVRSRIPSGILFSCDGCLVATVTSGAETLAPVIADKPHLIPRGLTISGIDDVELVPGLEVAAQTGDILLVSVTALDYFASHTRVQATCVADFGNIPVDRWSFNESLARLHRRNDAVCRS